MFKIDDVITVGADGRIKANRLYDALISYMCAPDANEKQVPVQVPAAANQAIRVVNFRCPSNLPGYERIGTGMEVAQLVFADSTDGTANANFTVWLKDPFGRYFSNFPIHVKNMFGVANYAALLREPFAIFQGEIVSAQFQKISGGAVNIYPYFSSIQYVPKSIEQKVFCDKRLSMWQKRREKVYPYWYTPGNPVTLTALQTLQVEKKISDAHHEFYTMVAVSTGDFAFEITEVQTGTTLMNGRISKNAAIGTAQLPTVFPMPYLVMRGSQLRFTFEDLSNAGNNIYMTLVGRKIIGPLEEFRDVEKSTCDIVPMSDGYSPIVIEPVRSLRA